MKLGDKVEISVRGEVIDILGATGTIRVKCLLMRPSSGLEYETFVAAKDVLPISEHGQEPIIVQSGKPSEPRQEGGDDGTDGKAACSL